MHSREDCNLIAAGQWSFFDVKPNFLLGCDRAPCVSTNLLKSDPACLAHFAARSQDPSAHLLRRRESGIAKVLCYSLVPI